MTDRWYLGAWLCDAWLSIDYCASTASIFNLFVLSLDRYWSITSPLKYLRRRTKRRAFFMIAAAWALSALWILPVTGWHSMVHPDGLRHRLSEHHCDTEFADNITFKVSRRCIITFYLPAPAPTQSITISRRPCCCCCCCCSATGRHRPYNKAEIGLFHSIVCVWLLGWWGSDGPRCSARPSNLLRNRFNESDY